jgi:HEPN domain-containing protein
MPGKDEPTHIVSQWLVLAKGDLKAAEHLLTLRDDCPTEVVCFHAQQCVEKYLKALLVARDIEFSKTHDIGALIKSVPEDFHNTLSGRRRADPLD